MDQSNLPKELRKWAEEVMEVPTQYIPSPAASKKLCVRQCADIWTFVIRHVRSYRTAKIIEGNVRWYAQAQKKPEEQEQKTKLQEQISKLKAELEHEELQLKRIIPELTVNVASMEASYEKLQDTRRKKQLLTAFLNKKERERNKLRETSTRIKDRVECFQDINRKSNVDIVMGLLQSESILTGSSLPVLEPEVLRDVKKATNMRYEFMKSLADDSVLGPMWDEDKEELRRISHQQWLSVVERVLSSHPANHILFALEHLARQNTLKLQELTASTDIHSEIEALKFKFGTSHLEDVSETDVLPSVHSLIQEGWCECEEMWVQQIPLRAQVKKLSDRLASVVQEVYRLLSDGTEKSLRARDAFELELKSVTLKTLRDTLLNQCYALEDEASQKKMQLYTLKEKQLRIREFRQLVEKKQEQIQILIKGTSCSKTELQKSRKEVQQFVHMKLLQPEKEIEQEVNVLHSAVAHEVQQFSNVCLPSLQRLTVDGLRRVPVHELSVHRLQRTAAPEFHVLEGICQTLQFPLHKAPEMFLLHVSDMKAKMMSLQRQELYQHEKVSRLQQQILYHQPEANELIQRIRDHDAEQTQLLMPRIGHLIHTYSNFVKDARRVKKLISDWWNQPGQHALPSETRYGLTLKDWQDRWVVAVKNQPNQQSGWS
ncbi:HAUS augmin-like complex subunit 5 isoform X2 [Ambystoma mexicanum]